MHEGELLVPPSGTWLVCNNETGLLTVAMHTGMFDGSSLPDKISGSGLAGIHVRLREDVRESQLRGSGGVSPRFPSISLWNKVGVAQRSCSLQSQVEGELLV
jgi:hypothetical protein